jgi:hypothetical protein
MISPLDGIWDTVTDTPMGAQKATLTLKSDSARLSGTSAGAMGSMPLENGKIDGNRATWSMQFMGLTLTAEITVDGNQLAGGISAPGFGTSPIRGQRRV